MEIERDRFKFCPKMYFRTTSASRRAIHFLIAELKHSGNLSIGDKPNISQEALANAVWLWLADLIHDKGPRHLEKILAPYLDKVDKDLDRDVKKAKKEAAAKEDGAAPEGFSKAKKVAVKKSHARKKGQNGQPTHDQETE